MYGKILRPTRCFKKLIKCKIDKTILTLNSVFDHRSVASKSVKSEEGVDKSVQVDAEPEEELQEPLLHNRPKGKAGTSCTRMSSYWLPSGRSKPDLFRFSLSDMLCFFVNFSTINARQCRLLVDDQSTYSS